MPLSVSVPLPKYLFCVVGSLLPRGTVSIWILRVSSSVGYLVKYSVDVVFGCLLRKK